MSLVPHRHGAGPVDVTAAVDLRLVAPDGEAVTLPVVLRFGVDDPYAVTIAFGADGEGAADVQWVFARELLLDGLLGPTGQGDVRIWPAAEGGTTCIALSSPDGRALLEARTADLRAFTDRSLAVVARGAESGCLDLDAEIGQLLTA